MRGSCLERQDLGDSVGGWGSGEKKIETQSNSQGWDSGTLSCQERSFLSLFLFLYVSLSGCQLTRSGAPVHAWIPAPGPVPTPCPPTPPQT